MERIHGLIQEEIPFYTEGNIVHFITDDAFRPEWSKALNHYFTENHMDLRMKKRYETQRKNVANDRKYQRFTETVSSNHGVIVDLASGPSGYFAPILDALGSDDLFIATDACPAVIAAHSSACNKENFCVFDVDLDRFLPFKDESVDCFSGNLLNNVNNYAGLVREAYRCLKRGGYFAIIELFFEHGCKTYEHLKQQNAIWSSFETFVSFCESVGFVYLDSDILFSRKGKISNGDLYPLDDNDGWTQRTVYFKR